MGFFEDKENVKQYMAMSEGYDGRFLIDILSQHLEPGASVLELGMGPGKDLDILLETYEATGSDYSQVFLELYRDRKKDSDVLQLDAVTLNTERKFQAIYSNKVLQHLTEKELLVSIERQYEVLEDHGLLFHSFWYGEGEEEYDGLRFVYYTAEKLRGLLEEKFELIEVERYQEEAVGDSVYFVARKIGV